jgi:phosphoenolpyruvate carboxylase
MRRNKSELNQTLVELQNTITSAKEEIVAAVAELREFVRVLNDDQAAAVAELREFVRVLNDDQAAAADRRFSGFPDVVGLSVLAAINDANDRVVAEVAESRELIIKTLPVGK